MHAYISCLRADPIKKASADPQLTRQTAKSNAVVMGFNEKPKLEHLHRQGLRSHNKALADRV